MQVQVICNACRDTMLLQGSNVQGATFTCVKCLASVTVRLKSRKTAGGDTASPRTYAQDVEWCRSAILLLREARRQHVNTMSRYSDGGVYCQTFVRDNTTGEQGPCTCGAEAWNARIDEVLRT